MTSNEFISLCKECEAYLRSVAPYDTGNLRYNAVRLEIMDDNTCKLYVDEKMAPYMKYTNEPWQHGKNPNEGWFDRAVEHIVELMAQRIGGYVK